MNESILNYVMHFNLCIEVFGSADRKEPHMFSESEMRSRKVSEVQVNKQMIQNAINQEMMKTPVKPQVNVNRNEPKIIATKNEIQQRAVVKEQRIFTPTPPQNQKTQNLKPTPVHQPQPYNPQTSARPQQQIPVQNHQQYQQTSSQGRVQEDNRKENQGGKKKNNDGCKVF